MRARKGLLLLVLCFAGRIALLSAAEGITSITILTFSGKVEISRRPNVWDPGHTNQVLQVGDLMDELVVVGGLVPWRQVIT